MSALYKDVSDKGYGCNEHERLSNFMTQLKGTVMLLLFYISRSHYGLR